MLENGFISLHRSLLTWEWYSDMNTKALFIHLLLTVNYEDRKWRSVEVKRGQRICSIAGLSSELGISVKSVRVALKHLKSTNEVASTGTNKYTLITVVNYDKFQDVNGKRASKRAIDTANEGQTKGEQGASKGQQWNKANKANNKNKSTPAIENESEAKQNYADNVRMTVEQYDKLVEQYSKHRTDNMIIDLSLWKSSKGKKTKCDYSTVMAWMRKEDKERPASKFQILQMPKGEAQCN